MGSTAREKWAARHTFILVSAAAVAATLFFSWSQVTVRALFGRGAVGFSLISVFGGMDKIGALVDYVKGPLTIGETRLIFFLLLAVVLAALVFMALALIFRKRKVSELLACAGFLISGIMAAASIVLASAARDAINTAGKSSSAAVITIFPYLMLIFSAIAVIILITLMIRRFDRFYFFLNKYKFLYVLVVPAYVFTIVFAFLPMAGLVVAFKDYAIMKGIFASPWAGNFGFAHFKELFTMKPVIDSISTTVIVSLLNMAISFPAPIIFALLLNEIRAGIFKKVTQTISYMPNFLSWISVIGLCVVFFNDYGPLNDLLRLFNPDKARVLFLSQQRDFLPFLLILNLWKTMGFQAIIFLAAITGVDTQLFEAASIDGAGRFKQVWHITIPAIMPTIMVMFILGIGGILSSNFELVWGLKNPYINFETIDTIVYQYGIQQRGYSLTTALGLTRGVLALGLTIFVNQISRRVADISVF